MWSHSTCESLTGGLKGVTGLMRLAEEQLLVGRLVAPDRAPQGPTGPHGPLTCSQREPTHRMEVHTGPTPNTNTGSLSSAG